MTNNAVVHVAPLPALGTLAVCASHSSCGPPGTWSTLLPVQFGLTSFLSYLYPTLSPASVPVPLYEVGDKMLGGAGLRTTAVLHGDDPNSTVVLTKNIVTLPDDGKRAHLAARTVRGGYILCVRACVCVRVCACIKLPPSLIRRPILQ